MLPAHLAENIRKQVLYYLQSTFDFSSKKARDAFLQFLENPESGIFKGPWVQLRRPFRPAPQDFIVHLDVAKPFHPLNHQLHSWSRLTSKNHQPEHTIVTNGSCIKGKRAFTDYPL